MSHFLVDPADIDNDYFQIKGPEAHHLLRVLRKKAGDIVSLSDGQGHLYKAELLFVDVAGPSIKGRLLEKTVLPPKTCKLVLYQGLPRGAKFDFVLEKATELGVSRVVPFLSEKNPIKDKASPAKRTRWEKLVSAAAKQSGLGDVPTVESLIPFAEMLSKISDGFTIALVPDAIYPELKETIQGKISAPVVNVVVGPESGFSREEERDLSGAGAQLVSLGPRILRAETAGLVALGILNYEFNLF